MDKYNTLKQIIEKFFFYRYIKVIFNSNKHIKNKKAPI